MREFIIADNQDISKAGMMFLLTKQKDVSALLEADNKAHNKNIDNSVKKCLQIINTIDIIHFV